MNDSNRVKEIRERVRHKEHGQVFHQDDAAWAIDVRSLLKQNAKQQEQLAALVPAARFGIDLPRSIYDIERFLTSKQRTEGES